MPKLSRPIQYVPKSNLEGLGGASDHGALTGLADDDHTQYHNDARGDARYYTQTLLDAGQLDSRYYTETEIDARVLNDLFDLNTGTPGAPEDTYVVTWDNGTSKYILAAAAGGGGLTYVQDDTDHGEILYNADVAFESDSLGVVVNGVAADVQPRINFLDGDGGTQVGNIRATSTGFVVDNRRTSGHLLLRAKDAALNVVELFDGDPDGAALLKYSGTNALGTTAEGVDVFSTTGTTPTFLLKNNSGVELASLVLSSGRLIVSTTTAATDVMLQYGGVNAVQSAVQGINVFDTTANATVGILLKNNGGTEIGSIEMDGSGNNVVSSTAGAVSLTYAGTLAAKTVAAGLTISDTSGTQTNLNFNNSSAARTGFISSNAAAAFVIENETHGLPMRLNCEDAGGTLRTMIEIDGDSDVSLRYQGTEEARTKSSGFRIINELEIDGDLNHDGSNVGFYATAPIAQQTGVAVTAAGVHAACVALGLFTA